MSSSSLLTVSTWLQQWIQDNEVEEVMNLYDKTGSGDISFDEFKALVSTRGKYSSTGQR